MQNLCIIIHTINFLKEKYYEESNKNNRIYGDGIQRVGQLGCVRRR